MSDNTIQDLKKNLADGLGNVVRLRDEIRVKMHLASLDAVSEWNRLEPKVTELEGQAKVAIEKAVDDVSHTTRDALDEVIGAMQKLRDSLH